jgi:hypothetical protein
MIASLLQSARRRASASILSGNIDLGMAAGRDGVDGGHDRTFCRLFSVEATW